MVILTHQARSMQRPVLVYYCPLLCISHTHLGGQRTPPVLVIVDLTLLRQLWIPSFASIKEKSSYALNPKFQFFSALRINRNLFMSLFNKW